MANIGTRAALILIFLSVACGQPPPDQPAGVISICGLSTPTEAEAPHALSVVDGPGLPSWSPNPSWTQASCDGGTWEYASSTRFADFKADLFVYSQDAGEGVVVGSINLDQACVDHGDIARAFVAVRRDYVCESGYSGFDGLSCPQTRIKARVDYWFVRCQDGHESESGLLR